MKKAFLAALTGVVVLAGCAKTEVTEVSDNRAINFSNFVTNSVKSIDNTEALTKFYVFGGFQGDAGWTNVFENEEVTKAGSAWTYDPTRYWTVHTYNFAAYSNNNTNTGVTAAWIADANKHLSLEFTIQDAKNDDLVYAVATQGWDGGQTVPTVDLAFKHILSKVAFQFSKAADLNGVNLTITDIKVSANTAGTFTGTDISEGQYLIDQWTVSGEKSDVLYNDEVVINANDAAVTVTRVMIPQAITGYTVDFSVTFNDIDATGAPAGEPKTLNFSVAIDGTTDQNWKPGYSYVYKAVIDAANLDLKPIVFTVDEVGAWEDDTNVDLDIPTGTI